MIPITDVLSQVRKGKAVEQATDMLAEVVRAVDATDKKGTLTLTITVAPEKGGGSQKTLTVDIKSKIPRGDVPSAIFFSDPDGDLHRTDPDQGEMFTDAGKRGGGDKAKGREPTAMAARASSA